MNNSSFIYKALFCIILGTAILNCGFICAADCDAEFVPGEILVKLKEGVSMQNNASLQSLNQQYNALEC